MSGHHETGPGRPWGRFLTTKPEGTASASDAAYQDVLAAFDLFYHEQIPDDQPIILAGNSQGSLHLTIC